MKYAILALCAFLAGCSEAEMKADAAETEKVARVWCDKMGIHVKGLECHWGGDCTLVTETEVVPLRCVRSSGYCVRQVAAK